MNKKEVWITGVGTVNPIGTDWRTTADSLLGGVCGIRSVEEFPLPDHLSKVAGRTPPIPVPPGWQPEDFARLCTLDQMHLWCSIQALQSSGLWHGRRDMRIGVLLGLGAEWMSRWEGNLARGDSLAKSVSQESGSSVEFIQKTLGVNGPTGTFAAACASGNYALAQARQWIRMGWTDVCLVGAGDMYVSPVAMMCFGNLRALSRRNDDPQSASRPFDRGRDGFVMGEGGAIFAVESAEHARRRGAEPLAEFAGFGASSDAFHMVIPSSDPKPAVASMRRALADAAINPDDVDYVNAHATSTPAGDSAESRVLLEVFGSHIDKMPVSSTKSMTGHLLSGAALMNALACLIALDEQALPPTINLDDPDPECALCHVPHQARQHRTRTVVSNALGFGGSNTTVVLRKVA